MTKKSPLFAELPGDSFEKLLAEYYDRFSDPQARVDVSGENPWNLPNWRAPEEYPPVEGTCDHVWRWEFVRRHPQYREVWLTYQSRRKAGPVSQSNGDTPEERLAAKLHLAELVSPACRHDRFLGSLLPISGLYEITPAFHGGMSDFCERAAIKGQYLIAISPNASLNDQLACIKADIEAMNRESQNWGREERSPNKPKWTRRNFPLYLRVLDAFDPKHPDKAGLQEVSSVLGEEKHPMKTDAEGVREIRTSAESTRDKFLFTMPA